MNINVKDKQDLLSSLNVEGRALKCLKFLNVEYEKLALKNDIQSKVKNDLDVPVLTDVHEYTPFDEVADVVDVLQTPAFLCRQTDFILKVCSTNKPVNIKKGQFTSPEEMKFVLEKAYSTSNKNIYLCERGYMFGYNYYLWPFL